MSLGAVQIGSERFRFFGSRRERFRVVGSLAVYPTTCVIQRNPLFVWGASLWEALFVVSQRWSFPTSLECFGWFLLGISHGISDFPTRSVPRKKRRPQGV